MKYTLLLMVMCLGLFAKAQHDPDDQILSENWDLIGDITFKKEKGLDTYPIYTPQLKKHENKPFELEGYIVPIKDGMKQSKFMLATLPINQCFFCGKNGVPIMVLVEMAEPIKFGYRTIKVKGNLKLSTLNMMDTPPVSLINAKLL
ncbi:MAG: hypothetical protein K2Q03_11025 [Sphingobacteriaceae bacterium]|nr:hypothetical protein [Sphingobacteriaceae bacterium]